LSIEQMKNAVSATALWTAQLEHVVADGMTNIRERAA
jgi:hypothetical protein